MTDVLTIIIKTISTAQDESLAHCCRNPCYEVSNLCYSCGKTMRALCYLSIVHPHLEVGLCTVVCMVVNVVVLFVGIQTLQELTVVDCER